MPLVPDWAPNLHPMVVHFPVAILTTAILFDLLAQFLRRWRWVPIPVVALYTLGAISAFVAFLTGRAAADSVSIPVAANPVLTDHADLAQLTMLFFLIYAGVRLALHSVVQRHGLKVTLPFVAVALVGGYLLWQTADHGAQLVYRFGVGIPEAEQSDAPGGDEIAGASPHVDSAVGGLVSRDNDSWVWIPSELSLPDVRWLTGKPESDGIGSVDGVHAARGIRMRASKDLSAFTIGPALKSVQVDATVNLDDLRGTFGVLHNVQDSATLGFFSLVDGSAILGRIDEGRESVLEEGKAPQRGRLGIRVVADAGHYRGYVNDQLVAHGHGHELETGPIGIWFRGSGTVVIERIEIHSLR